jgi:hypothetical protein
MRGLINFGLGCSGCLTIVGLVLTVTILGASIGVPLAIVGAIALVAFAVTRLVL